MRKRNSFFLSNPNPSTTGEYKIEITLTGQFEKICPVVEFDAFWNNDKYNHAIYNEQDSIIVQSCLPIMFSYFWFEHKKLFEKPIIFRTSKNCVGIYSRIYSLFPQINVPPTSPT